MRASLFAMGTALLLPLGCTAPATDAGQPSPNLTAPAAPSALTAAAAPPDLSGAWNWSRVEHLTLPAWVAALVVGIEPEGPITQVTCEGSGTMTIDQSGRTFSGTATQTIHGCETAGGQQFQSPGASDPIVVADGRISGRSIHFRFESPTVKPCPHDATISEIHAGTAVALTGTGRCFVPGHPKSESPIALDPPQAGTSKTVRWKAVRP